ncbi:MAG: gluconate 2-dehydrogenase subunit 3 family protein [Rhodospirillaceae bacterium]|nr:gluconate 2-dehydrogenase subunit 3 family protein [Rhodospirillaceae bacterium]
MGVDQAPWNEAERRLLNGLLDEIVPASADGRVPAAGVLGVVDFLANKASDDPALAVLLRTVVTRAAALVDSRGASFEALDAAARIAVVEALERAEPDAFTALLQSTYMGYYSRADVRPHFGLSDRPTQPDGYVLPEDDPDELADLLAPVRARGRCFRPT